MHSFPVPVLSFAVRFLSPFLASLPQLFHECLPSPGSLRPLLFRHFSVPFRFLSSASVPFPATQPSVSSFPSLPGSASRLLPRFPRSFPPDLSCALSRFSYSASCLFPFALPRFASHSRSTGASLTLSPSGFSASLPLPFVRLCSASSYSAFLLFLSVLPGSASQLLSRCCPFRFRFPDFPLPFHPVSRAFLPFSVLGFSARFLSSLPVPLPQPLPWCLPSSGSLRPLLVGLFRSSSLSFVRSDSLLTTQLPASSFPVFPVPLTAVLPVRSFPFRQSLFPCLPSGSGTQHSVLPFSRLRFASQLATSLATACLSV